MMQSQHVCKCDVVAMLLARGLVAIPGAIPWQLGLQLSGQCSAASLLALRWHLCPHCTGVIASIACLCYWRCASVVVLLALTSLPSSCWRCCPCCTRAAASIANRHLPSHDAVATHCCTWCCCHAYHHCPWPHCRTRRCSAATWPSIVRPMQCWLLFRHCVGIIAHIVLASLPALCCHHPQHCVSVVALVALASAPLLHPRHRQHCKLASAQSQCSCNTSAYVALLLCP
jgi:hypothetical protein